MVDSTNPSPCTNATNKADQGTYIVLTPTVRRRLANQLTMLWSWMWKTYLSMAVVASSLTFVLYGWDKWQSKRRRGRRVSEKTLHQLELVGGWPGAWLAQGLFRHKNRKSRYQFSFRMAMTIHVLTLFFGWLILS